MLKSDDIVLIKGCIPYSSRKEKKAAWKSLKEEFDDKVKIMFGEGIITYSAKVNRNSYF